MSDDERHAAEYTPAPHSDGSDPACPLLVQVECVHPVDRAGCAALARGFALRAGLDAEAAGEVALAVAELVGNAVRHGGGGRLELRRLAGEPAGVEITVSDRGPGIADPSVARLDGWSRGRRLTPDAPREGLGSGLGAAVRMMDVLRITSPPPGGTTVVARKWRR